MASDIAVIGACVVPGCGRPAGVHLELSVAGRDVRGTVCERCERATYLGVVLLAGSDSVDPWTTSRCSRGRSTPRGRGRSPRRSSTTGTGLT